MRVLIIEDDPKKAAQLRTLVAEATPGATIAESRSYQSGVKAVLSATFETILLDMSMPTFDRSPSEKGGRTRPFGGRDILREMQRKGVQGRVVVVTGFETFGEGENRRTLAELRTELRRDFAGLYVDTVYYHPARSDWRERLSKMLRGTRPRD